MARNNTAKNTYAKNFILSADHILAAGHTIETHGLDTEIPVPSVNPICRHTEPPMASPSLSIVLILSRQTSFAAP